MRKENNYAKDLTDLWNDLEKGSHNYSSISNIMRNHKDGWDGFLDVGANKTKKNVFSSWVMKTKEMFLYEDFNLAPAAAYTQKKELLQRVKEDVAWWLEYKGSPLDKANIDLSIIMPDFILPDRIKDNPDLYEEWCDIWLDNLQIEDRDTLLLILIKAMSTNNIKVTKKILKNKNLDINLDIEVLKKNKLDIRNIVGKNKWGEYFSTFGNKFYDPTKHTIKSGFFARSKEMAELLTESGFNWNVDVCDKIPLLSVLQNCDHFENEDRDEVIKLITRFNLKSQGDNNSQKEVFSMLKGAKYQEDIDILLSGLNWWTMRGENGENIMHVIAKYAPHLLADNIGANQTSINLTKVPDNDGIYPLEYFFCFTSSDEVKYMHGTINTYNIPKPDWLTVKLLIAKNNATYSMVDSASIHVWKQKSSEDFKKCLETERGQELIEIAANSFPYNPSPHAPHLDSGDYPSLNGMEIIKYANQGFGFEDCARLNKVNEIDPSLIKLYLVQSLTLIKKSYTYGSLFVQSEYAQKIFATISVLIDRAINLDIGIAKIKEKLISEQNGDRLDRLDRYMCENVKSWSTIEIIEEHSKLQKVIKNNGDMTIRNTNSVL